MADSPFTNIDVQEFLKDVPLTGQKAWISAFGPDIAWIEAEILKARAWWIINEDRRRHGDNEARFVNGWLTRAHKDRKMIHHGGDRYEFKNIEYRPLIDHSQSTANIDSQRVTRDRYRTGAVEDIKRQEKELEANPADPERVKKLIQSVMTGKKI
jgi:hypothetical protein